MKQTRKQMRQARREGKLDPAAVEDEDNVDSNTTSNFVLDSQEIITQKKLNEDKLLSDSEEDEIIE